MATSTDEQADRQPELRVRFSDFARKVMQFANREALRLGLDEIDTDQILLGILKNPACAAAQVLKYLGIDVGAIRPLIDPEEQRGTRKGTKGKLPQSAYARAAIDFALDEAGQLKSERIGTEHLLLGLLHEQEGTAGQLLIRYGAQLQRARDAIRDLSLTE